MLTTMGRPAKTNPSPILVTANRFKIQPHSIQVVTASESNRLFHNPRLTFKPEPLASLERSIKDLGLLKPLVVKKTATGYELVAGERRLRCVKSLVQKNEMVKDRETNSVRSAREVYAHVMVEVVQPESDLEQLQIAIAENMEHSAVADWDYFVLACTLADQYGREKTCKVFNKSAPWLCHTLALTRLPQRVQDMMRAGRLSRTAAIHLLSAKPDMIERVLKRGEQIVIEDCDQVIAETTTTIQQATLTLDVSNSEAELAAELGDENGARAAERQAAASRKKLAAANQKLNTAITRKQQSGIEISADAINRAMDESPETVKPETKKKARSPKQAKMVAKSLRKLLEENEGKAEVVRPGTDQTVPYAVLEALTAGIEWCLGAKSCDPFEALSNARQLTAA
jgi:ParB family chromosome partitioning protein